MKKLSSQLFILFLALLTAPTSGCGSDDSRETPTLTQLNISSSNGNRLDIVSDETTVLTVVGQDQSGNSIGINSSIEWSVNNSNVSIDADGKVSALAVGASVITAAAEGLETTFDISVWDSSAPRTDIYVSDAGNFDSPPWQILIYDENGANPRVFTNDRVAWPQDILILEDQEVVLVSNLNTGTITKYDINSGDFISNFASGIGGPTRMKIGPDNLLYVLQWSGNGLVKRYELNGTFVDDFTSVGITQSIGLDWDTEGNLYVSSFDGATVRKFDSSGSDMGLFISSGLTGPTNIWFAADDLIVNDWSGGAIRRYDNSGNFQGNIVSGLSQVEGIAIFDNGNFIIGNGGTASVKMYNSAGNYIKDLVPSGRGGLIKPNAITLRKVNQ
ncbi:hypothetical protein [Ekhidna sp.]|uniref:hypothetical protein n=1 Tax=Ekhidna sp. TaxID=2608089 RepID=UPI003296B3FA